MRHSGTHAFLFLALLFFFLLGAVAPIIVWLLAKKYPNSFLNYVKYVFSLSTLPSTLSPLLRKKLTSIRFTNPSPLHPSPHNAPNTLNLQSNPTMLKIPLHGKTYDPSANQYPVSTFRLSEVARVYAIGRVEGERRGSHML